MSSFSLTIDADGYWCLAGEEDPPFCLRVEYSKSGRAKCRTCNESIPKNNLRIGKPVKWRGLITSWNHPKCFWVSSQDTYVPQTGKIDPEQIHGFRSLTKQEKKEVLEAVKRKTPPESLETFEEDDTEQDEFGAKRAATIHKIASPITLNVNLLPFQEEGYSWMLSQEQGSIHGGILADEMGMGKTIQTLALILKHKLLEDEINSKFRGPTLVVCPASAMLQWQEEIVRCSTEKALKIFVFHGQYRQHITPSELNSMDVILTTYPTLEYGYRVCVNALKVPCQYCGKMYLKAKLVLHNKYFCGPNSKRSARLAKTEKADNVPDVKQKLTMEKAMRTLKIKKSSIPTPANIYRELMASANKVPVSMYTNKADAATIQASVGTLEPVVKTEEAPVDDLEQRLENLDRFKDEFVQRFILWTASNGAATPLVLVKSPGKATGDIIFWSNFVMKRIWKKTSNHWVQLKVIDCEIADDAVSYIQLEVHKPRIPALKSFRLRVSSTTLDLSHTSGSTWENLLDDGKWVGFEELSRAASASYTDLQHRYIGKPVARMFDKELFLGVVIDAPEIEGEQLWKVTHYDGDVEDLSLKEVKTASTVKQIRSFFEQNLENFEAQSTVTSQKNLRRNSANEDRRNLFVLQEKERKSIKKKPVTSSNDSSDDSEFVVEESNSSSESSSESENEIQHILPRFVPAVWGIKGKKFAEMVRLSKSPSKKKKKKRKRKVRKTKASRKRKTGKSSAGSRNNEDAESTASEYTVASSSSEEEEVAPVSKAPRPRFRYAEVGEVVDEDGIDLSFSLLHCIAWKRIILDEAHKIKDRTNSTAKAAFALRGYDESEVSADDQEAVSYRWCLTGTPLQNRVGELYALIRFLRVDPFAYYYCSAKDCGCKHLNWNFGPSNRKCKTCGHAPMRHYSHFNKVILNPIKRVGFTGAGRKAMLTLRDDLLYNSMLRRTKKQRETDLKLPKLESEVVKLKLTAAEQDFYESVYMNTRSKFDIYVKKGTLLHNYAHIFELLSRLRRCTDHPYLVIHGKNTTFQQLKTQKMMQLEGAKAFAEDVKLGNLITKSTGASDICGICNSDIDDLSNCALGFCRHTFHKTCATKLILENKRQKVVSECPVCFQPLSITFGLRDGSSGVVEDKSKAEEEDALCVICFDKPRNALLIPCGHLFTCTGCISGMKSRACPMCRSPIKRVVKSQAVPGKHQSDTSDKSTEGSANANGDSISPQKDSRKQKNVNLLGRRNILQKISLENFESSTKVDAVVVEVQKMRKLPVKTGDGPHKAIIFSQYSDMIDLVEWKLRSSGIQPVRLVGSMSVKERQAALTAFRENDEVIVILMSLKAGGEGLNLQAASHVFILETWWNPQVHNQAFQRAHRIGQKRNVRAVLFVTDGTIEERMYELQEKKELVFQGAVERCNKAMKQLTEEDLRFLFTR